MGALIEKGEVMETIYDFARGLGLDHAADMARAHGAAAGIVRWNGRLRSTAGRARGAKYHSTIELNPKLRREGRAAIVDTFLHELAHILTPGAGHGPEWRAMARRLGHTPKRTHRYVALRSTRRPVKVVAKCEGCGVEIRRRRAMPRGVEFKHTACGGRIRRV